MKNNLFCNFFAFFKQPETVQKKKKILMLSSLRATFLKSTRYFAIKSRKSSDTNFNSRMKICGNENINTENTFFQIT